MTSQLIPVFNGTISNETALLVNARDLHTFLDVGKRFASWIVERIAEYGFVENQDFMIISQVREKIGRGRPAKDYHLTLDTAKELAMVERNEKGRQVRRYFIECEKRLRQQETKVEKVLSGFMPAIMEAIKLEDKKEYSAPLKPGYRSLIHSPSGVLGLTENSLLMNLLNQLQDDGHDVSGAAAELTTMFCYIVGVSKCLRDIQTHAEYINDKAEFF
ncbi:antA/AntB antirepressor family protein [Escherichia coli]|mgnify:FL=1|uniref:antA/AntB antirepressor family protein n=1 Tax=Escherichia coli TaxID=562 RepID=UPI001C15DC3A|nr:antA/AntB antirepressor family protein [Escherichia coli]EMC0549876.1 antA/AntB antirepressor family protein [Escherichia coli]MCI3694209.1 antA/AntB antirepressor family protein [Escherichia coli]MDK2449932.1 antA/AntB antirepressor family protein [Escherichia coli]MDS2039540.1 antA/AntB antirepressor family protein [Escherichia coli]MDS2089000.1 antA/AntB antirepressor family protein [Escherichia coli]